MDLAKILVLIQNLHCDRVVSPDTSFECSLVLSSCCAFVIVLFSQTSNPEGARCRLHSWLYSPVWRWLGCFCSHGIWSCALRPVTCVPTLTRQCQTPRTQHKWHNIWKPYFAWTWRMEHRKAMLFPKPRLAHAAHESTRYIHAVS